jgi:hypothetical protein
VKKAIGIAILGVLACSKESTAPEQRRPTTVIVTSPQAVLVVNTSMQLTASLFDQRGAVIPNATIVWQSLQPQVASVTSAGLVSGVAVGTATIRATSQNIVGEVTVRVDPDPCTTPVSLQVGDVRQFSGPAAVACVQLAATTGPSDFLFVTGNASQASDELGFYSVNLGQQASATASIFPAYNELDARVLAAQQAIAYTDALEANIRTQERVLAEQVRSGLRAGGRAALDVLPDQGSAVAPQEGQTITVHVPRLKSSDLCTNYVDVQAVVKKVSAHAVIAQDVSAPGGGFTQQDFTDIAAEWENLILPTDTLYFGGVSDRNQDGHVTILYTSEVNRATDPGASGFIAGFFWGGDLVKKTEYAQVNRTCPQTNEEEIFYLLVPDPTGSINNNVRSVASVRQGTRGVIAHEFQHMINEGKHLLNPDVTASETIWLNEALSHMAEDIVGRALRGFSDFQNLGFLDVNPNPLQQDDYNAFFRQNLLRLRLWMLRPDTAAATSNRASDQLAPRGAGWMFLRYLTDQFSTNNAKAYLRRIVAGPDIGIRNLLQWSNGAQFDDMLSGFLISQYTDDLSVPNLSARYTLPSWKVREAASGVNNGAFPLLVSALPANVNTQSLSGSGNYFRLTRTTASPVSTFRMLGPGGSPVTFPSARVWVVRLN